MVEAGETRNMKPVKQWRALYRECPVKFNAADRSLPPPWGRARERARVVLPFQTETSSAI